MLLPQQSAIEGFLASIPPYAELDQRALKRIARTAAQFEAPRRTVIFRPGESAAGIHILMSGHVKLALPARDHAEKVIAIVGPGQSFGELGMFLQEPHCFPPRAWTTLGSCGLTRPRYWHASSVIRSLQPA